MIPDPEREQALHKRLARLIGDDPAPDAVRLREALVEARSRAARRRRGRRARGGVPVRRWHGNCILVR